MAKLFDLHIHTSKGSGDSNLSPDDLILEAERLGLLGLCITEHSGPWDRHEFAEFASRHNVVLVRAMAAGYGGRRKLPGKRHHGSGRRNRGAAFPVALQQPPALESPSLPLSGEQQGNKQKINVDSGRQAL